MPSADEPLADLAEIPTGIAPATQAALQGAMRLNAAQATDSMGGQEFTVSDGSVAASLAAYEDFYRTNASADAWAQREATRFLSQGGLGASLFDDFSSAPMSNYDKVSLGVHTALSMIADANGLTGDAHVRAGMSLTVPRNVSADSGCPVQFSLIRQRNCEVDRLGRQATSAIASRPRG